MRRTSAIDAPGGGFRTSRNEPVHGLCIDANPAEHNARMKQGRGKPRTLRAPPRYRQQGTAERTTSGWFAAFLLLPTTISAARCESRAG